LHILYYIVVRNVSILICFGRKNIQLLIHKVHSAEIDADRRKLIN